MERIMGKLRKRKRSHLDVATTAKNGSKRLLKYLAKLQFDYIRGKNKFCSADTCFNPGYVVQSRREFNSIVN